MKRVFVYGGIAVGAVGALIIVAAIFVFSSLDGIVRQPSRSLAPRLSARK